MHCRSSFRPEVESLQDRLSCSAARFAPVAALLVWPIEASPPSLFRPVGGAGFYPAAVRTAEAACDARLPQPLPGSGPHTLDRARAISGIDGGVFDAATGDRLALRDQRTVPGSSGIGW